MYTFTRFSDLSFQGAHQNCLLPLSPVTISSPIALTFSSGLTQTPVASTHLPVPNLSPHHRTTASISLLLCASKASLSPTPSSLNLSTCPKNAQAFSFVSQARRNTSLSHTLSYHALALSSSPSIRCKMPCRNMPSYAGGACMCRTRKCAEARSAFSRCSAASSVGWSERHEMLCEREGECGRPGGRSGAGWDCKSDV